MKIRFVDKWIGTLNGAGTSLQPGTVAEFSEEFARARLAEGCAVLVEEIAAAAHEPPLAVGLTSLPEIPAKPEVPPEISPNVIAEKPQGHSRRGRGRR